MDEINEKSTKGSIIQEIITHLNNIEEKISALNEVVSESKDIQLVNKLDIVNLKNDIEKLKLSSSPISHDQVARLSELMRTVDSLPIGDIASIGKGLEELSKAAAGMDERLSALESMSPEEVRKDMDLLRSELSSLPRSAGRAGKPASAHNEKLSSDISELKEELMKLKHEKPAGKHTPLPRSPGTLPKELVELRKEVEQLKRRPTADGPGHATDPALLQRLSRLEAALAHKPSAGPARVQPNTRVLESEMQSLKKELSAVRERVSGLKPVKLPQDLGGVGEMREDLASVSSQTADLERAVASIERSVSAQARNAKSFSKTAVQLRKEVAAAKKAARVEAERGKKEAIRFILKQLQEIVKS